MGAQIDSIPIKGLRKSHLRQLSEYIHSRDETGWYYRPKDQFEKRHEDLLKFANQLDSIVNDSNIKIKQ